MHALPLKESLGTVAVIGPTAESLSALVGNYNGTPARPVTILQGIRNVVEPGGRVIYAAGSPLVTELLPLEAPVPAKCLFTDSSCRQAGLKGDYYNEFGEMARPFRTRIDPAVDFNWSLETPRDLMPVEEGFYACWNGVLVPPVSGTYQIGFTCSGACRLYVNGQKVVDDWTLRRQRLIGGRVSLQKGVPCAIRVEYFHGQEDAKVQLLWTRPDAEPFYAEAVRAAEKADTVVVVLGLTAGLEREQETVAYQGFGGGDRQSLALPQVQEELLQAVCATGKPVTLVLTSGSGLAVNWAAEHVSAIVQAWYPGEQGGNAVADVLFGKCDPAGRLPITFYKSVGDLPPFEDYSMKSRTYRYFHGEPLWPFGYGLSYTTFSCNVVAITTSRPTTAQDLTVRATVRNTGAMAGDEVVQLYVSRPGVLGDGEGGPIRSLEGFMRVSLQPGESKDVEFTLTPYQLAVVDEKGQRRHAAGRGEHPGWSGQRAWAVADGAAVGEGRHTGVPIRGAAVDFAGVRCDGEGAGGRTDARAVRFNGRCCGLRRSLRGRCRWACRPGRCGRSADEALATFSERVQEHADFGAHVVRVEPKGSTFWLSTPPWKMIRSPYFFLRASGSMPWQTCWMGLSRSIPQSISDSMRGSAAPSVWKKTLRP